MQPISLRAEEIFHIGGFAVTNAMLMSSLVLVVLVLVALALRRRLAFVPGAVQNVMEIVVTGSLGLMDSVLGNRRDSEHYFPLVFTIFLFIICSNWLGLIPGVGSLIVTQGGQATPLLRSPASDLNFTLALALIAVTFVNVMGVAVKGARMHLSTFINFKSPIGFFVGLLELISELAKIISFSFRLFGNIFAGEVLLAIMAFLIPYLAPLPFMFLEVFVGFIQAFIFAMLTLVFISAATTLHEGEGERHGSVEPRQI
jgi:F-type H+-transporting ATPase subunit a